MGALAAGSLLTMGNVLQIGSSASDLLGIISFIEGRINSDKSISDQIHQCIEDAIQKAGRTNYLDMRPSDKKLLEIVIKEYYGESHDKPYWFRDDEFKKFYDSLIDNSDFLGILQGLKQDYNASRQNKKLDNVGQSIQDIKDQIERQGEQQSTQLDNVLETVQKDSEQIQEKQEQQLSLEKEILEKVKNNSKSQKQIIAEPEYPIGLRRYENVLCINEEISFLDDATENLIRDSRLFLEDVNIDRVRHCLDKKKACLIMAPEGRGKTFLSRIIAYKYHHEQRMEVFFLDFKDSNRVRDNSSISIGEFQDQLQEWHKIKEKNYFLVLENVHAYHYLSALKELIVTRLRIPDNHTWFLLNARPTDIELEDFSDWEEQTVDLKPDIKNINRIIDLYAKELGREPFGDNEQDRTAFIERIYPHENNPVGANLRLLSIYLKTWQKHPEKQYITDIDEQTILKDFRKTYLENKSSKEKEILWYISCLYQFDVPLHEDLNQEVGNFKNDFLRYDGSQYHLPHSVDAFFLFKAICNYKKSDYREKTREFINCYVNAILASSNPRKFEGDFRLLTQGLIERKDEFRVLINELADWPMAEKIIRNIDSGFVIKAFNPQNGHSSQEILDYYKENLDWLKTSIFELSSGGLRIFCHNIMQYTNHNVFEDIFKDPKDLENYLRNNDKVFRQYEILEAISGIGEKHKHVLIDYYKQNKDRLKPSFLELGPTRLYFIYRFFKSDLNIVEDIFKDPKDLENYLRINDKVFLQNRLLEAISGMGVEYKRIIIDYYKQNIDRLKSSFLELGPTRLYFIYRFFKSDLNIVEDIFKDPKDLENYLRINDKVFLQNRLLEAISGMGVEYKRIIIDYYKQNIDRLKSSFLGLSPTSLYFIYRFFKSDLNVLKDIFEDPCDLDTYLRVNYQGSLRKTLSGQMITVIRNIGDNHRLVLEKYRGQHSNQYDYHFLSSKNGYGISQASINYLYGTNTTFDVLRIDTNKFYFIDVHWGGMQRLIKVIQRNMNDENRQHSLDLVKAIIQKVLEIKGSLSHASAHDLSHFYTNIDAVDHETYQQLIEEESVISDINGRLDAFTCTIPNLYLFGHFYSQPWCKEILEQKINNADDGQIAIIKEWYDKVMEGLKKRSEEGEETEAKGGLLEYIHNKPFIQQQNN